MQTALAHALRQTVESYKGVHPTKEARGDGWQVWYAQWLLTFSDLNALLGITIHSRELEQLLLRADYLFQQEQTEVPWHVFVAEKILALLASK